MTRFFALVSFCVMLVISVPSRAQDQKDKNPPDEKEMSFTKVTIGYVSYVLVRSEVTGAKKNWTLVLDATSKRHDQKIYIGAGRAITVEGKTFDIKSPMVPDKSVSLPEGGKVRLALAMGPLPESVNVVTRLELFGSRNIPSSGIPGLSNRQPLVLQNVLIGRPD